MLPVRDARLGPPSTRTRTPGLERAERGDEKPFMATPTLPSGASLLSRVRSSSTSRRAVTGPNCESRNHPHQSPLHSSLTRHTDLELRKAEAEKRNRAVWKYIAPENDVTPTWSYGQEKLAYYPPAPGTIDTKHRKQSGEFMQFANKALMLGVDLKATSAGGSSGGAKSRTAPGGGEKK
jgi:hypothetical protein